MQKPSHAEWTLSDAWRSEHWPTHCGGASEVSPRKLEIRLLFSRGKTRGEVSEAVLGRLRGDLRGHPSEKVAHPEIDFVP